MECQWEFCFQKFKNTKQLHFHYVETHVDSLCGDKRYTCKVKNCHFPSNIKSILKIHITKHTTFKPFKCCFCNAVCKTESNLRKHTKMYHIKNSVFQKKECLVCNIQFQYDYQYQKHKKTHDISFLKIINFLFK
jgi:hypothetical protein